MVPQDGWRREFDAPSVLRRSDCRHASSSQRRGSGRCGAIARACRFCQGLWCCQRPSMSRHPTARRWIPPQWPGPRAQGESRASLSRPPPAVLGPAQRLPPGGPCPCFAQAPRGFSKRSRSDHPGPRQAGGSCSPVPEARPGFLRAQQPKSYPTTSSSSRSPRRFRLARQQADHVPVVIRAPPRK